MNFVDILILLFLLFGAVIGFKDGFTKSLVNCIGYIVIIIIAFILKNPLSEFLMSFMPFFDFFGLVKGLTVFNIAFYEIISFVIIFSILLIILKILLLLTSVFEKILTLTIILGIPSKILGMIIGVIKNFVIVFCILYILNFMNISIDELNKSKFKDPILNNTPLLSNLAGDATAVAQEFTLIKDKYQNTDNNNEFNLEVLNLFLKYNVVTPETASKLLDSGKLKIEGAENLIEKYEGDEKIWLMEMKKTLMN